jgi:hypothetical protein
MMPVHVRHPGERSRQRRHRPRPLVVWTGDVPALEGRVGVRGVPGTVQAAVAFSPPTGFRQMDAQMLPLRAACHDVTLFSVPNAGHDRREVLDPANHTSHTACRTTGCREQITTGTPDPTWDTIESFIARSLRIRR